MSASEIRFRSRQKIRIELEKLYCRISGNGEGTPLLFAKEIRDIPGFGSSFMHGKVQFFGLSKDSQGVKSAYRRLFPANSSKTVNDADNLLKHKFHLLGKDFALPNPIDWNRNPFTSRSYPKKHYSDIQITQTQKYGDIKYLWELNRHQFFIELGKAYFLTGDEKYPAKIREWIESWISGNPYKLTVNWTSALESAIRIFSWVWTFYFTFRSEIWSLDFEKQFLSSLILEGAYISENLSYYFSPYNHLIGELAALSFLGTIFPDLPGCENWRDKYWNEMEAQIDQQFHSDGFTVEQASYYHHFTLGFYLMIALLRKQNNLPVSDKVWDKLEQGLEIVMYMTRPDGHLPMIGDIDNARSIYFYFPKDQWDLKAFLALGAVIFNRGDMKYATRDVSEEVLWLLGSEGIEKYQQLSERKPEIASRAFKHSGYFMMRDGWDDEDNYCYFDCGEIAHGVPKDNTPSAAHGHADILSFELTVDGKPIIIDPGSHTYFGSIEWHRYFRSTQAHNTITVNECSQAQHEGRISWSKVSSPKLNIWFSSPYIDFVGGAIDRFANLEKGIFHRRFVLFRKPFYFLIMDEVVGKKNNSQTYDINSFLHFAPGELDYKNFAAYHNRKKVLLFALPEDAEVKIETDGEQPHQGWIASGYGYRSAAPVMQMQTRSGVPVRFGMLFPTKNLGNGANSLIISDFQNDIIQYILEAHEWQETIYLNPSQDRFKIGQFNSIETDALCLIIKFDSQGIGELHCVKPAHLMIGDDKIVAEQLSGISLDFHENHQYQVKEWKQKAR